MESNCLMNSAAHERPESNEAIAAALEEAVALLHAERLVEADALLAQLRTIAPDDPDAQHFQGVLRHAQGRNDEGIALIQSSLAQHTAQPGAWNNLGNLLVHAQRFDEAAEAYQASVTYAGPSDASADALNNIATLQRRRGLWIESEASARRAIALRPHFGDAWYNLSLALMGQGQERVHDALLANSRAVALWPRQAQGRAQVIRALTMLGEREEAAQQYRDWLVDEPGNPVVQHLLAACEGETPPRASDGYVESVFDAYAASFDASLERLHYRAPELVTQALARAVGAPRAALAIVDAGCGTGLCGPLLKPWAAHLAGCDLSVGMLRRARPRGVYDVLRKAELIYYLQTQPSAFDVVVSADTLCYFGDLHEVCAAAAWSLKSPGWLVFTVEAVAADDAALLRLQPSGRYAHSADHVRACLIRAGFEVLQVEAIVPRVEAGLEVAGWLVSAKRTPIEGARHAVAAES